MVSRESILRRLPANLDRKQALFLDGIRHAGEIAALAYGRLQQNLTEIAISDHIGAAADQLYTAAFLDAWSLVDVVDRFRTLWSLLPNTKHGAPKPGAKTFGELSQSIRNLRNVADHLAQRADYVVARKGSALGVLSWFTVLNPKNTEGVICTIVPGTLQPSSVNIVNPAGQAIELPTGLIHLYAGEHEANLSAIIPEMSRRIRNLEIALERRVGQLAVPLTKAGADLLLKMTMCFDTPGH